MTGRPNLDVFADTLLSLARQNEKILAATTDSRGSGKLTRFGQELPDQIIEMGIAEQNLVGFCRVGLGGQKGFCRIAGLLPDGARAGTNQK
jgi:transketolase